jgi:hypothetical protein
MNSFPPELLQMILGSVDDAKTLMVVVPNVCTAWKEACAHMQVHLNFTWGMISPSAFIWVCRRFPAADRITCRSATDWGLALSRCVNLKIINLRGCRRLTNNGIKELAKGCGGLVDINVSQCWRLGDASLMALGEHCRGLTAIDFSWCALVSNAGVAAVAVGCKLLERVNFDRCYQLHDPAMLMVAANCLNLTHIDVWGCRKLTDVGVRALVACPNLVEVNLERCDGVSDAAVVWLKAQLIQNKARAQALQ